jgi:hypothetical protein
MRRGFVPEGRRWPMAAAVELAGHGIQRRRKPRCVVGSCPGGHSSAKQEAKSSRRSPLDAVRGNFLEVPDRSGEVSARN